MIEHASKLRKVITDMTNKLGRAPTDEELMVVLEISREKLNEIQSLHMKTISISTKVGDSDDSVTIADFIESQGTWDSPDRYATAMLLRNELKNIINDLSDEEQSILILRYGLLEDENQKMYSFDELALMLEIPKEKVKKLEAKALRKLKSHLLEKGEIGEYL
jgi:RNA polymerase nonessential primary-like sigma factor